MTLTPINTELLVTQSFESFGSAKQVQEHLVWEKLGATSVSESIDYWLGTLCYRTKINYESGMRKLSEAGLIHPLMSLQEFALVNHEAIVDKIKLLQGLSECTRQARAACYISFTSFLSRRSEGVVRKAMPCKDGNARTFFKVREKVDTDAMSLVQWMRFFKELEEINSRDALIAKIILQGGKRVSEVLDLKVEQIDWEKSEITFVQSKTKGFIKNTIISYPKSIMGQLRSYVSDREGYVFLTRSKKPVHLNQLSQTFYRAGVAAGVPFKVTPHVLRASAVTYLRQQGFPDSDIMRVTGHASAEMVLAYDKSSLADNPTKRISLVF